MHDVFRGGARAVGSGHDHDVLQLLAVAGVHALEERTECFAPGLARTLVEVVHDVVGEAVQHPVPVAAIERGVVPEHGFGRAIVAAHAVDPHGALPPGSAPS